MSDLTMDENEGIDDDDQQRENSEFDVVIESVTRSDGSTSTNRKRKLKRYQNTGGLARSAQYSPPNRQTNLQRHMAFDNIGTEQDDDEVIAQTSEVSTGKMRLTATNQDNYVEDVKWINGDYERPEKSFMKSFTKSLRVTDMGGRAKLFIRNRFLFLFEKYEKKHRKARLVLVSARVFVTLGSLIVPAMVLIDDEISDRPPLSQTIYYATVGITLAVSIVNALAELLQCSKRFYTQAATHYLLEQEAWSFLLLRGKYRFYQSHRHCWQTFLYNVERIHQNTSAASLLLHKPTTGGGVANSGGSKNDQQNPIDGAYNPDILDNFVEENKQNDEDAEDPLDIWRNLDPRNTAPRIITVHSNGVPNETNE